ncbi:hypothetical protein EFQ99_07575 [Rhizobium vallis]|uniref:Uncharacterized protein n=1 Tax=Rhizobium vallis TaxID=634290 RepID=A0A432PNS9_9HYPH|nr:hypothetical protein EFQ99_07575 [Rhizobium vallis]
MGFLGDFLLRQKLRDHNGEKRQGNVGVIRQAPIHRKACRKSGDFAVVQMRHSLLAEATF